MGLTESTPMELALLEEIRVLKQVNDMLLGKVREVNITRAVQQREDRERLLALAKKAS